MGLDVTHDCWHGAYSAFARFRCEIAVARGFAGCSIEGLNTAMMTRKRNPTDAEVEEAFSFERDPLKRAERLKQQRAFDAAETEMEANDPVLWRFWCHSDCDGTIEGDDLVLFAKMLEETAGKLSPDGEGHLSAEKIGGGLGGSRGAALKFAAGLRRAAEAGEIVRFH